MIKLLKMKPVACVVAVATVVLLGNNPALAAEEFSETKVIIEINATDGDAGFHTLLDAAAWRWVKLSDPDGNKVFNAKPSNGLREQGLTENFFESAEPVCDPDDAEDGEPVVSLEEFIGRFPEGDFAFRGKTLDGEKLAGTAELTYDLPAAPDIELTEEMAFEFDSAMPENTPILLMWEAGDDLGDKCHDQDLIDAGTISDPADVEVIGFEVVIEPADDELIDPQRKVAVQLRGDQGSLTVPGEYLASLWEDASEEGVLFVKFEVGAIEESGNQTFSEGEFCLYSDAEEDCVFEE